MKNLAELKRRIVLGTKIVKVDCCYNKNKTETLGKIRTVDHVQSNAFTMDGSWLYWRKAGDYEIEGNTFSVYFTGYPHTHDKLIGKYEILE